VDGKATLFEGLINSKTRNGYERCGESWTQVCRPVEEAIMACHSTSDAMAVWAFGAAVKARSRMGVSPRGAFIVGRGEFPFRSLGGRGRSSEKKFPAKQKLPPSLRNAGVYRTKMAQ